MRRLRLFILVLIGLFCSIQGKGVEKNQDAAFNPANVLMSHFSFARPTNWQWISTEPRGGSILTESIFSVGSETDPNRTAVYLNHFKPQTGSGTRPATIQRWKTWFKDLKRTAPAKTKTIGTNDVTFVEFIGTYQGPTEAGKPAKLLRPDYTLYGAVIEDAEGNILARLWGPTTEVQKNKAAFQTMIEKAAKGENPDL
jgi:hypothetical protein